MSFFCRKASHAGISTGRFGVRKPSPFLLPRGGPSGGEGAANTSRADEVETPHWEQSEVCMQWELLCEMQSFLGEVNHLSSSVRVEESSKIAGWEGTAGPAPAGALRAEPVASRSDAEFILDIRPSQGPIPEHPTTAKRAGFTKRSRLVPSVPYNTFFSVCVCSLTNCPLALGRSSPPYFADRVLSAEIVCSFVLY